MAYRGGVLPPEGLSLRCGAAFALFGQQDAYGLSYAGSAFVTLPAPARDLFWMLTGELAAATPAIPGLKRRGATYAGRS